MVGQVGLLEGSWGSGQGLVLVIQVEDLDFLGDPASQEAVEILGEHPVDQ